MATKTQPEEYDPNPGFGKFPLSDVPQLLFFICARVPAILGSFVLTRPFSRSPRSWKEDLKRTLTRNILNHAPLSVLRQKATLGHYSTSPRYKNILSNLNKRIQRPEFAGNWLYASTKEPKDSDVVILFIHGGGYVTSSPHSYATFLLRIIETVLAGGKTVSLFNLDYSLAPEAIFPTQLKQAEACYAYLTEEMGIESEKIALMGDSAGGHISLGLLCHLNEPMDGSAPKIETEKPGKGLFLISPWVGLFSQDGYKEKETSDLLSIQGLERWARMIVGGKKPEEVEPYTEFVKRVKGRGSWKDILPDRVWVSAGGDEIFLHNIGGFVNAVKEDGVDAEFEVKEGEAHDWQMAQAVGNEKKYLEGKFGDRDDGLLVGADGIGRAILGEAANNEVSTPTIRRVSTARSGDSSLPPLINLI